MNKQDIIKKIKKCLALSQSSNEHEAAQALKHAQILMQQYGLSSSDIALEHIEEISSDTIAKTVKHWQWHLMALCAEVFACQYVLTWQETSQKRLLRFIGPAPHAQLSAYAFTVLNRQLRHARKDFLATIQHPKNSVRQARANQFSLGFVFSIKEKIAELLPDNPQREAIETYLQLHYPNLSIRQSKAGRSSGQARHYAWQDFQSGQEKGEHAALHPAMQAGARKTILLSK